MTRLVPIALASLAIAGSAAAATTDEWNKSFTVTGRPALRVVTNDGHVRVCGWSGHEIAVRVLTRGWKIGHHVTVDARQSGDQIEVIAKVRPVLFSFEWGQHAMHIEVMMPRDGDLDVKSGDGRVEADSINGRVTLSTSDGGVTARHVRGTIDLHSSDGSIIGEGLDGTLSAGTSDGGIQVSGRFDRLDLDTSDGSILATAAPGSNGNGGWTMRTSDGPLTLRLPSDFKSDLDAQTGDGHITVDFPVEVSGQWGRRHLHGTLNGGGPLLRLRTGDGSIRIGKL